MKKELPGWLETLYNANPGLAERAEKYIDTVWNEAIEAAAENVKAGLDKDGINKQSILKLKR